MNKYSIFNKVEELIKFSVLMFILSGCVRQENPDRSMAMMQLSPRLNEIFKESKKVCFGRFLVEIPSSAIVVFGPTEVEVPIYFYPNQSEKISVHLNKRLSEIEEERRYIPNEEMAGFPLFGKILEGSVPGQKMVFGSKDQINYAVSSFIPIGEDLFIQDYNVVPVESNELSVIKKVSENIRSRSTEYIPETPGMCINGGFVSLNPEYERAAIGIRLKEFPDVHLSIDAHKNQEYLPEGSSPSLLRKQALEKAESAGLGSIFSQTKLLREGPRKLNIWNGEEIAIRTPSYKNNKSVHEFRFHSMGSIKNALHPELDIRFDSGIKNNKKASIDPSLTDEEALAVWDKIINSIRVRQSSDASQSTSILEKVKLGENRKTGEACPQTGYWGCRNNQGIFGDGIRKFTQGEVFPSILLNDKKPWVQKLLGNRRKNIAVTWELVRYDLTESENLG